MDLKCDSIVTTDDVLELYGPVFEYRRERQKFRTSLFRTKPSSFLVMAPNRRIVRLRCGAHLLSLTPSTTGLCLNTAHRLSPSIQTSHLGPPPPTPTALLPSHMDLPRDDGHGAIMHGPFLSALIVGIHLHNLTSSTRCQEQSVMTP